LLKDSILVFACTHIPFEHPKYLDFLLDTRDRVKCGTIVCLGDLVDNHSLSMKFDQDPNGLSPTDEIREARLHLKKYFKAFPSLFLSLGNHDSRVDLKAKHVGLPEDVFRPFRDIWGLPKEWKDAYSHEIDGVKYMHGTGLSGDNAPEKASILNRQSTVIAHIHHNLKSGYMTSNRDRILYMGVGCGIDIKRYAFEYNRDFIKRPVLGCGVITDRGTNCQVFPMNL
jgi:predicted phosphodiesterase